MSDLPPVNDVDLTNSDIGRLENSDQLAHFFARLGYDVDGRTNIPDYALLGLDSQEMRHQIYKAELLGADPVEGDIIIYLFEVRSVTAKLRNGIARRFRERLENAILVLTTDYEELEFVLLERLVTKSRGRGVPLRSTIRPIPLTVDRRRPDPVARRVLKRFTFTETDAAYQWEKLRSAYTLAEWSEVYFNNRALFSDYYLKTRLTDPQLTPAWNEDVRPIGRALFQRLATARRDYTRQPAAVIRAGLYEPLFEQLGFTFTAHTPTDSAADAADYLLYGPPDPPKGGAKISPAEGSGGPLPPTGGLGGQPLAAVLTYVWNRNLDAEDESREPDEADGGTPFEIPGALVVSLLEAQVAPWVIVTNGKLWRLYSATTSNKATNYYEVDLEEALNATDQLTALKYWWLLFRAEAFTGFLDELLRLSADYAKALGDRLKERVFVDIFPQFAQGFIADLRAQGQTDFDEAALTEIFSGTLTFLYRLMFILYAESLELLPINEVRGYRALSLYRLKNEIAETGGTVQDEAPARLAAHYAATGSDLYDRLTELFKAIDQGADQLNLPTYNGGLFSPDTAEGRFLARTAIPDRFLALGLDRLARDVDSRSQALVFIDFKSLGVRQLGSIYEGLLEFKLRLAAEPLAVTKKKGREIYQPAKKVKKPLALIAKGAAYLENDKQERKATGSYYTPDYIVKYIVRHTVGPVLDRKFEALEPRLREAQKGYRDSLKLALARQAESGRPENLTKYWNSEAMRHLVDDCLNVRVLDPAMGSGHFLVEVVDYVSNRLLDFLNGWSDNPVWAFLERTRDDIMADMERQQVAIDAERLTRVALLKRAVLKRCIYGVDLNGMAVELAKVSLWLDAFTLGAPLSFLDHHLKHGNSLIGARIPEVQDFLGGGGGPLQLDMFSSSEFAGLMLATDLMRQISYKSDNTPAQAQASAAEYRAARDHLAPFKRMLDVYTSRWFGNAPPKKDKSDPVQLFLKQPDVKAWLKEPTRSLDDSLIPAPKIAATALTAAAEKRFFHWELEFPEIFFAPSAPGGQDVQLREDGGFDAVVGNPPYGNVTQQDELEGIRNLFISSDSTIDNFALFIEQAANKLTPRSSLGYIIPSSWQTSKSFIDFRKLIINRFGLYRIVNLPYDVFKDAYIDTMIFIAVKQQGNRQVLQDNGTVRVMSFGKREKPTEISEADRRFSDVDYARWFGLVDPNHEVQFLSFLSAPELDVFIKIIEGSIPLNDITDIQRGISPFHPKPDEVSKKYKLALDGELLRYHYDFSGKSVVLYDPSIAEFKPQKYFLGERIILRQLISRQFRLQSVLVTEDFITNQSHQTILLDSDHYSLYCLQGLINSNLLSYYYVRSSATALKDDFPRIVLAETKSLPIRRIDFTTPTAERERLTREAVGAYDLGDNAGLLRRVRAALEAGQTDVIHDLLAHLAHRMIDLNQEKQAEIKRFLAWLEERLQIQPKKGKMGLDALTGKTILQNYLGDYQKGEPELAWPEFHYRLHQNRRRYGVPLSEVEGEIEAAFGESLARLRPLKEDLRRTDALIDKIVYRLYGLSAEEIELIERPQYEQGLTEAKAAVVGDEKLDDDEERLEKMAEGMLAPAKRFFERVEPTTIEAQLDRDLPGWRHLSPEAPTFLLTGDYNLHSMPAGMDFSTSIIPYTKAVETVLYERLFAPFRDGSGYSGADCRNKFLAGFMRGERKLTLGSFIIILKSSKETALRSFIGGRVADVEGLVASLSDEAHLHLRNKAAHDEVLSRADARQIRGWALGVLGQL